MLFRTILEREGELAALDVLIAATRSGRGGVAIIEGEPGVGKSTLLAAGRERAEACGLRVLAGRGSQLERDFTFGVARQLLDDPGSVTAPPPRANASGDPQEAVYAEIQRLFDALVAPCDGPTGTGMLVAVDDAQWADEQSLRFLAHLALRVEGLPIVLLVTVRTGEPDAPQQLLNALHDCADAGVLTPRPLSHRAVAAVVSTVLGDDVDAALPDACARASGGNPFYLRELLNVLEGDRVGASAEHVSRLAPPRVLRSVMVRIGRLGRDASALARAMVVLGDGAPLRIAAQLAELDRGAAEVAADALATARILTAGEPLRFTHPVIGSALASEMGHFDRRRAHARAAELLLVAGAPPERVAAHLLRAPADEDPRAVAVLEQTAAQTLAAGGPKEAARLLARALEEPPAAADRPRIMLAAAKAAAHAGLPTAVTLLEDAVAALQPGEPRADGLAELAAVMHHKGGFERAHELARRARCELADDHPAQERLLAIEIGAALLHPRTRLAIPAVLAPLVAAARAGRPPTEPSLLAVLAGWMGVAEAPALVRRLAEAAIAGDPLIAGTHGESVGWVASALIWTDELALAERWLGDVLVAAGERGSVITCAVAALNRATARYHRGRLTDAIEDAERALDIYRYGWTNSPWSTPALVMSQVARGDLPAARTALAIGERAGTQAFDHDLLLEARCQLHLASGDAAAALADARAVGERVVPRAQEEQPRLWAWRRLGAAAAQRLGRQDEARELVERDLADLREIGPARQLGAALTVAGIVAGGTDGIDLLGDAVEILAASPARLQHAESLVELGAALRRAGHRSDAKAPLYEALELADGFGARPLVQRAREELGVLGARPRRTARFGPESLTSSERRVVQRAADGLSTPEIAGELCVSTKTVESHLWRAYRKLGVTRRGDLASALQE